MTWSPRRAFCKAPAVHSPSPACLTVRWPARAVAVAPTRISIGVARYAIVVVFLSSVTSSSTFLSIEGIRFWGLDTALRPLSVFAKGAKPEQLGIANDISDATTTVGSWEVAAEGRLVVDTNSFTLLTKVKSGRASVPLIFVVHLDQRHRVAVCMVGDEGRCW